MRIILKKYKEKMKMLILKRHEAKKKKYINKL